MEVRVDGPGREWTFEGRGLKRTDTEGISEKVSDPHLHQSLGRVDLPLHPGRALDGVTLSRSLFTVPTTTQVCELTCPYSHWVLT